MFARLLFDSCSLQLGRMQLAQSWLSWWRLHSLGVHGHILCLPRRRKRKSARASRRSRRWQGTEISNRAVARAPLLLEAEEAAPGEQLVPRQVRRYKYRLPTRHHQQGLQLVLL